MARKPKDQAATNTAGIRAPSPAGSGEPNPVSKARLAEAMVGRRVGRPRKTFGGSPDRVERSDTAAGDSALPAGPDDKAKRRIAKAVREALRSAEMATTSSRDKPQALKPMNPAGVRVPAYLARNRRVPHGVIFLDPVTLKQVRQPIVVMETFGREDYAEQWQADFGKRLEAARIKEGLSQSELARRSGLHQSHISKLEAGRMEPRVTTIFTLADAIGIRAGALLPEIQRR
jgi:HTH-type transcriptional regulator/antitoxin HipB